MGNGLLVAPRGDIGLCVVSYIIPINWAWHVVGPEFESIPGCITSGDPTAIRMSAFHTSPNIVQGDNAGEELVVPGMYLPGYQKAREISPRLADRYIRHTTIGDPLADALVSDTAQMEPAEERRLIHAVMESEEDVLASAPSSVQALYHDCNTAPSWVDYSSYITGIRGFHANISQILGGMVGGVLIEGFSTAICESFLITGRLRDQGVRRLKQNNRHMLEIFLPGGLERHGDGWKLSVRIRLVHARIRHLLSTSPQDWDVGEMGTPISAAHMGFAVSSFSARLLRHATQLGATFGKEERASFMQIWRHSGHLMGIPDSILYTDEKDALELREVAVACEPEPSFSSIIMANALINSAPLVIGIRDPDSRRDLVKYVYMVSASLIGRELAQKLHYPETRTIGVLPLYRLKVRATRLLNKLPFNRPRADDFQAMLDASMFDHRISYDLPDHAHAEHSQNW